MSLCRACGQGQTLDHVPFEDFQSHAHIYFDLMSIRLHEHEDPSFLKLCSDCVDKLNEFDRFRDVCLRVHDALQVKTEPEQDFLMQQEEADQHDTTDDEMLGDEEPSEVDNDGFEFEEVNIDEEWSELKFDPDLTTAHTPWESSSFAQANENESNPSVAADCAEATSGLYFLTPYSLENLLQGTLKGQQIIEKASLGPLPTQSQNKLATIVAVRHFEMKFPLVEEVLRQYAVAITDLFKHESQDTYFLARGGARKNPAGKLYTRILYVRKQRATCGLSVESIPKKHLTTGDIALALHPGQFLNVSTLETLLNSTAVGRRLLERAPLGPLSTPSQNELVTIVTERHLARGYPTAQVVLQQYADAITGLFKYESKDTYFVKRCGSRRNHSGKFYNRIGNMRQKAAKRQQQEESHLAEVSQLRPKSQVAAVPVKIAAVGDQRAENAISWLDLNSQPWDCALHMWTASYAVRKQQLTNAKSGPELLTRFKHVFRYKFGYQLVDIDFRLLAIGNSDGLEKWSVILPSLVTLLNRHYQDDLSKAIAEYLTTPGLDQDSILCGVLMLLNTELRPVKVKQNFKPSILIAQRDIIIIADTDEQVKEKLIESKSLYATHDIPIVPRLVFRGKSFRALTGSYEVHYNDVVYRLNSAARAIDVMVKFNTMLGLEYSRICRLIWNFICSFIYELPVLEQYESINKVKRLLAPCVPVG